MHVSASARLRSLAAEDPGRPAIVARDRTWTYAELDAAVEQHAAWLNQHRDAHGRAPLVALRYRSTAALIVSSLALSRSGSVCALIDPLAPAARVRLVLDDLSTDEGAALLITDNADDLAEHRGSVRYDQIAVDDGGPASPAAEELGLDELQNVIYTSGSTGVPVGLRISGRQREAISDWARTFDAFKDGARVGVIAAGSLGQSAEFPRIVIATGGTILVHDVLAHGLNDIPRWLREQRVEAIGLVPTLIRFLLPLFEPELGPDGTLPDLVTVAVWGESSNWDDLAKLARHLPATAVVHNAYATTETGMIAALSVAQPAIGAPGTRAGAVPAGRALPGVDIRILDTEGDDVPAGSTGEIAVASAHLAQGHWKRPDLTASVLLERDGAAPLWRTGDAGRLDDAGMLHVAGRLDDVVKISGHRVALGELEQAARALHGVSAAAAVGRADAHEVIRLHLYVVADPGAVLDPHWLRAGLARSLPPAALPDTVDVLDALPLLGNGKVHRKALPTPAKRRSPGPSVDDAFLARVTDLFAEMLDRDRVDDDDDFFELGGDSLRAGRLVAALQTRFGHAVATSLLLEAPTPRSLAAALSGTTDAVLVPVRTAGSGVPLFVVHGGMGDVMFARPLAGHLGPEQPVYALQPPALRGPRPFAPTLHEVAGHYVAEVRKVWPHGPYRLFGYSMGGVIAFEMATILQDAGDDVDLLALGDSPAPETMESTWRAQQLRYEQGRAARSVPARVRDEMSHRGRQVRRRLAREPLRTVEWRRFLRGAEPAPQIRGEAYLHVYGRLAFEHRFSRQYKGTLMLVTADDGDGSADRGWSRHVDGAVHTVAVDAGHLDLIVEPALTQLARALRAGP